MAKSQKIKLTENLNRLMGIRKLTVTSVARKVGMNKSTLHNYCNGVIPRNLPKIKELADLFEVSLSELIFGSDYEAGYLSSIDKFEGKLEGKFEITIRRIDSSTKNDPKK